MQQPMQGIDSVAGAQHRLDRCRDDMPIVRQPIGRCQPLCERRHSLPRLQRIARRDEQPDLFQSKPATRLLDDMAMPGMRGIERTAKQTDAHAPAITKAGNRLMPGCIVQGRTCPVPRTR